MIYNITPIISQLKLILSNKAKKFKVKIILQQKTLTGDDTLYKQ